MYNVISYIKKNDDNISIKHKFNEIDSLILARLSYLVFDKINMNTSESLESISNKMKNLAKKDFIHKEDYDLINWLGKSSRFKNLKISDYVKDYDYVKQMQFQALTIHINKKYLYVSFMGTDYSILGWKEDFNMVFLNNIPYQMEALNYLEKIAKKYPYKRIFIGGHSKGGNASMYAALMAKRLTKWKIIKVFNYDGPGFDYEFYKKYKRSRILKKIITYFPEETIIGRLFDHLEKIRIVKSTYKGLYQHNIYSWKIDNNSFIYANSYTQKSDDLHETMIKIFNDVSKEQRKRVVETLFSLFNEVDTDNFNIMIKKAPKYLPGLIKKYRNLDKEEKNMIYDLIKLIFSYYKSITKSRKNSTKS